MTPLQFTRNVRSLNRLRRITQVLTQHGFGHIVARMNLARFVPVWIARRRAPGPELTEGATDIGRRIARVCADLGPTFVKLGQMMSTRPDIVPADVLVGLRALQDEVPPFDTSTAMEIIASELGRPVDACLAWIADEPLASGSIGQVYRARTVDGTDVVVKVRRPGIEEVIRLDMQVLKWFAETLESVMPELRIYRPRMLVSELEEMLTRELDYVNEASATARFGSAFAEDHGIQIPAVYWDLSGPRVLTLEALEGVSVGTLLNAGPAPSTRIDRRLVARRLTNAYLKQVFELGLFHADPHPGNLLVQPDGRVAMIDFGQVGSISDELIDHLTVVVYASVNREVNVVVDALADLGALGPETDRRNLRRGLQVLLDKYYGLPLKRLDLTTIVAEFSEVIRKHDVIIPKEVVLLCKAVGMVAGLTAQLDPDLDMLALLRSRLQQTLRDRFTPARLARGAAVSGWHLLSILRQAPSQLREALRHLAQGTWQLRIRHENIEQLMNELDRSSNRLAFSIVIAGIIVGSSVVVSADSTLTMFNIKVQNFGLVGYLIAGILGLGLAWAIFRSGRLH